MEKTPHVLLVGKGAEGFACEQGFRPQRLLTRESTRLWREWKRNQASPDASGCGHDTVGVIGWQKGTCRCRLLNQRAAVEVAGAGG